MNKLKPGLYLITEDQKLDFNELITRTEQILSFSISALQYRKKNAPFSQKIEEASALKILCEKYKTPFIVNDDLELAKQIDSDGIHLGEQDDSCRHARAMLGENKIIGISCYNDMNRAERVYKESADYLAFGAMYKTTTKENTKKASPQLLVEAKQRFPVPLVAIGGITPQNSQPLLTAGADLLAVVNSIYYSDTPEKIMNEFKKQFETL